MEPEALEFLKRVGYSILTALIWLGINAIAAIKGDNAFIGDHITVANVVFYIWAVISVVLLVFVFKKVWQR